jgi:hypothetical protein
VKHHFSEHQVHEEIILFEIKLKGVCDGLRHYAIALTLVASALSASPAWAEKYSFLVVGDPQYLAEKSGSPEKLDRFSEEAAERSIAILQNFAGRSIPAEHGGGKVSDRILGLVNTGDLIDSLDKTGGDYPAMQQFEWARFKADYGLTGKDGKIPFPVYEMHGNHDGPQGDTFLIDEIIQRNQTRLGVTNLSDNGLHYSWDWGPLHNVALGIFVGEGEARRDDHHYAPRASLEFLRRDLAEKVGDSGRPVILYYHIHPNTGDYDWPQEDLAALWETIQPYNVIAMFHGHTHGSPPSRMQWDGVKFANDLENGIDIFNPDDVAAAKADHQDPEKGLGFLHGLLYVELIDNEGADKDSLIVRSYATRDNWATHDWHTTWTSSVTIPAAVKPNSPVLAKRQILESHDWWDNRDFNWYESQIPFLETPNQEIDTTWYYRWDLLTKHLTYGSANTGYTFTEFIDRPFWSGAYGAISCPAGHQLYEARWLRAPRIANDYSRYWLRTPGAQPRNYSHWLADSIWAVHQIHPDEEFLVDLLDDLVKNYEGWEQRQFVPEVGLFWQTGHDDGMEFNINSRQTRDILRGAPSYRPSFNAYMWADAQAIARIARLANRTEIADRFTQKADSLKAKMLELMWDQRRQFFFPVLKNDEERDGHIMKALTRTYESGQHAGDPHGRELIGYVPWQFNLLSGSTKYDIAWKKLTERDGFYADFGPSTVERNDPMFLLSKSCCWWSGQSWPYATTQTLKALANSLQSGSKTLTNADYITLLDIYARSHRKDGKPYLAEALHPDTGSFEGHDGYNHSEHYFHSGYCDLVITGLAGLVPREDDTLEVRPLAPAEWDYFALDAIPYRGHLISIVWDKNGDRYQLGKGLHLLVDGQRVGGADNLEPVLVEQAIPLKTTNRTSAAHREAPVATNFVVNNDGTYFPRTTASYTEPNTSVSKLNDGNYWYLLHPPNRWTCQNSPSTEDWIAVDFGTPRTIHTVKLYILDDSNLPNSPISVPQSIRLESWTDDGWNAVDFKAASAEILGHRPHVLNFAALTTQKLRATLVHAASGRSGLTEFEAWGDVPLPLDSQPHPPGNLAYNDGSQEFPIATASHHDRFGGVPQSAIDGKTNFLPTPTNRWTSYESPNDVDWLQIDFGTTVEFDKVDLGIYDDRGGVQRPIQYEFEIWRDDKWQPITDVKRTPDEPAGSQWNSATFARVSTSRLRIHFMNRGQARSGVTEVMVWNEKQ